MRRRSKLAPEKRKLKAETPPVLRLEIAGIVPPLSAKAGVGAMIPGKFEPARPGHTSVAGIALTGRAGRDPYCDQQYGEEPTAMYPFHLHLNSMRRFPKNVRTY